MLQLVAFVLSVIGALMMLPAFADFSAGNPDWLSFAASSTVIVFLSGISYLAYRSGQIALSRRDIFKFVPAVWLVSCLAAALPFYLSGLELSFTDAFFEAVSGLTTTGSTILSNLDGMPPGILLWRSLTEWIGGLGIVVLSITLLPFMKSGGQQLFSLESSDTAEKPFPKTRQYAERIALIYLLVTICCAISYMALEMTAFEAINHAMATVSTGGFSTTDDSMGRFATVPMLLVSTIFMGIGGLPFLFLIRLSMGHLIRDVQITVYLAIILAATFLIYVTISESTFHKGFALFVTIMFNVVSVITTTGFASEDYLLWGPAAVTIFFFLTFIGGCAGSTAGGFKQFRFVIAFQVVIDSLVKSFRPNQVRILRYGDRKIDERLATSVMVFSFLYAGTFIFFAVIYSVLGLDFETGVSASATALANVGPGVGGIIGPAGNFASLSNAIKWMLCWEMIVGRLELMSVYVILIPAFWR
ncbi:MAG: TrkH family potassium uptake protein [Rhodobiaceae bacterium]|nr:TrkH family potassium uptake protein [Rhodobiaceae bacterium]MCC0062342.1 TrkH family potassium uptake protein [Rhodobiaceae bacterium]